MPGRNCTPRQEAAPPPRGSTQGARVHQVHHTPRERRTSCVSLTGGTAVRLNMHTPLRISAAGGPFAGERTCAQMARALQGTRSSTWQWGGRHIGMPPRALAKPCWKGEPSLY